MRTKITLALTTALALAVLSPSSAGAATSVSVTEATQNGAILTVTGSATFDDEPFVTLGTDGIGDTFTPGFGAAGGDMTSAAISTTVGGLVRFRWVVSDMAPAPLDGAPTGVIHAWNLCVSESCFEIDGGRNGLSAGVVGPYASLWSCASSACDPGAQSFISDGYLAEMSAATKSFTVTMPADTISASPGSTISGASGWSAEGPVFTDVGDGGFFPVFDIGDGVTSLDEYQVPRKSVWIAVGASGQDPVSVAYTGAPATPAANGSFSASTGVSGLTGPQTVYAKACFGSNNCAYGTLDVVLA
jgi:hypothetical protein